MTTLTWSTQAWLVGGKNATVDAATGWLSTPALLNGISLALGIGRTLSIAFRFDSLETFANFSFQYGLRSAGAAAVLNAFAGKPYAVGSSFGYLLLVCRMRAAAASTRPLTPKLNPFACRPLFFPVRSPGAQFTRAP